MATWCFLGTSSPSWAGASKLQPKLLASTPPAIRHFPASNRLPFDSCLSAWHRLTWLPAVPHILFTVSNYRYLSHGDLLTRGRVQ